MTTKKTKLITTALNVLLSIFKSIWSASITIIWGVAGILLSTGLIIQYQQDPTIVAGIFSIMGFLMEYWLYFLVVLFLYDLLVNFFR